MAQDSFKPVSTACLDKAWGASGEEKDNNLTSFGLQLCRNVISNVCANILPIGHSWISINKTINHSIHIPLEKVETVVT